MIKNLDEALKTIKELKIKPDKKGFTDAPITLLYNNELNDIEDALQVFSILLGGLNFADCYLEYDEGDIFSWWLVYPNKDFDGFNNNVTVAGGYSKDSFELMKKYFPVGPVNSEEEQA